MPSESLTQNAETTKEKSTRAKASKRKHRGGRGHAIYTQEMGERICARLEEGESLSDAVEPEGITASAVHHWLSDESKATFATAYAHARKLGWLRLADQLLAEADRTDIDPQDKRIRVDTRKWMLAKMLPKVYGDGPGTQVNVTNNSATIVCDEATRLRLIEQRERLMARLNGSAAPRAIECETTPKDAAA